MSSFISQILDDCIRPYSIHISICLLFVHCFSARKILYIFTHIIQRENVFKKNEKNQTNPNQPQRFNLKRLIQLHLMPKMVLWSTWGERIKAQICNKKKNGNYWRLYFTFIESNKGKRPKLKGSVKSQWACVWAS